MTTDTGGTGDLAAVLAANEAFYRAFASGDVAAMEALWARRAEVACVHPGWPPLHGRVKVMESWRGILARPPDPPIRPVDPVAQIEGSAAHVICFEAIGGVYLVATNLFVRERGAWKIIHHQAGQTEHQPRSGAESAGPTLH